MSIPNTDLSYFCIWPKTEVNHDFGDSELFTTHVLNNESSSLRDILKTHVGDTCSIPQDMSHFNLVNDEEIVKKVFNKDKGEFRDLQEGWSDISVKYKGHRNGNKVDILTKTIKLFKIKKNESSQIIGLFKDDSKNIFKYIKTNDASKNHVFFIQDVAGDVVKQLKYVYDGVKKYHIHIINSVETIGDSASKIKPDCKKKYLYKKDPGDSKTRLFSWLYTKNRELNGTKDDLMFSSYKINTRYAANTGQFKIDQVWSISESSYYYDDINKKNNRTNIRNEIKEVLETRNFYDKSITDKDKQEISRALQRKRSGDYLQIKFAKDFPTIGESDFKLILPDDQQYQILNKQDWEYPNPNSDSLIKLSTDIKKNNTFIITNDWPCLSYAIFNEVNVIFHNNSPTCKYLLVFQFNF